VPNLSVDAVCARDRHAPIAFESVREGDGASGRETTLGDDGGGLPANAGGHYRIDWDKGADSPAQPALEVRVTDDAWYVEIRGKSTGPLSRMKLESMRRGNQITSTTLVWREDMPRWVPYSEAGLAAPTPPPLPSGQTSFAVPTPPPLPSAAARNPDSHPTPNLNSPPITQTPSDPATADGSLMEQTSTPSASASPPALAAPALVVADDGWQSTVPSPWRRYFARMFDIVVIGMVLWLGIGYTTAIADPDLYQWLFGPGGAALNPISSSIFTIALLIPFEAVLMGLTGTSIGKWIFGVRVTRMDGRPIGLTLAAGREVAVFFSGLGLGLPIVSLITLISAYSRLTKTGTTTWDEGQPYVVTHRPFGFLQFVLSVVGVTVWLACLTLVSAMNQAHR